MSAFISAYPELAGVIAAAIAGAVGFFGLSYRWAAAPTSSDPHDEAHGDVPNLPGRGM